jgi:tetratricopeptide (TPR) repeat protein
MAQITMSQNYFEDAIPLLESGLKIAPRRPDLLAALGESYFMAGKTEKAVEEFNLLLEAEKRGLIKLERDEKSGGHTVRAVEA